MPISPHRPTPLQLWLDRHQWARDDDPSFSVALDCPDRGLCIEFGPLIAEHLSDVHAGTPSGWLYFDEQILLEAKSSPDLAETLSSAGRAPFLGGCPGRCGLISGISQMGAAVLYLPDVCRSLHEHPAIFVVGLRPPGADGSTGGDLSIDLSRIATATAVRMIADSALEWAAAIPRTPPHVTSWKS